MFSNNLVMAIKANGKVLREFDGKVYLPFGSEYSILLKNLAHKKVKVTVSIDGSDALDGTALIIDGRDEVDLKRFIRNGNFESGNAFKFIEKTAAVEKHRGNKAEDGLITITYEYEVDAYVRPRGIVAGWGKKGCDYNDWSLNDTQITYTSNSLDDSSSMYRGIVGQTHSSNALYSTPMAAAASEPLNDNGVTAPGSITDQKFVQASPFYGDGKRHNMTIELKGQNGNTPITKEVTVKRLTSCSMCGNKVRQTDKFCSQCGAAVEIV